MQRLVDRDLLTALVLFFIGGVALFSADDDVKNWMFPLLATTMDRTFWRIWIFD